MSQSNRLRNSLLVGLAVFVLYLVVLAVYDLKTHEQSGADRIQSEAAQSEKQRQYAVANCPTDTPIKTIICVLDAQATEQEQNRSHEDLEAQQESARAAFWSVFLACVQALVAIGGFFIVFRSLDLTQAGVAAAERANDQARVSSERQLRAYVTVERIVVKSFEEGKSLRFDIILVNTGQTPARQLRHMSGMAVGESVEGAKFKRERGEEVPGSQSVVEVGAGKDYTILAAGKAPLSAQTIATIRAKDVYVFVGGYVSYRDVFRKRHLFVFRGYLSFDDDGKPQVMVASKNNRGN